MALTCPPSNTCPRTLNPNPLLDFLTMILRGAFEVDDGLTGFVIIPDDETFRAEEGLSMFIENRDDVFTSIETKISQLNQ